MLTAQHYIYICYIFYRILCFPSTVIIIVLVRYHSGGSMKLYACILLLAHMVYL